MRVCHVLLTNLPRVIVAYGSFSSSFRLKRGILPLSAKYVSYIENHLPYQTKIVLVKLNSRILNLLLANYLISVAVAFIVIQVWCTNIRIWKRL